jgi:hypothetical protein
MNDFQQLPTEIRLMIWKYVGMAEPRVVAVDHSTAPFKSNIHKRKLFVREKPPILLHICQESRQLALSQYGSFFRLPPPQAWTYTGPRTSKALNAICHYVGVPKYRGSKIEMEKRLTDHVNHHQAKIGLRFKKILKKDHGWGLVPVPRWLNPAVDTLLLKLRFGLKFQEALWHPRQTSEFPKLRKIALVIEYLQRTRFGSSALDHIQKMLNGVHLQQSAKPDLDPDARLWYLPELHQISIIALRNREVFQIEVDDTGLLKAGQWAYSLAPPSEGFKEEMDSPPSGVLWKVTLAKEDRKCLVQLALNWAPNLRVWESQKVGIYTANETAFIAKGYPSPPRNTYYYIAQSNPPEKQLVEGGDGKTYLGVSLG